MSSAREILVYLVARSPRPLTRTELVKFAYLVDWGHTSLYGKPVTDIDWVRHNHGPFASSILDDLDELQLAGQIYIRETTNWFGNRKYVHEPTQQTVVPELPRRVQSICDRTLHECSKLSFRGLIGVAYSTPPMKHILEMEQKEGSRLNGRRLELERFGPKKRRRVARGYVVLTRCGETEQRRANTIAEYLVWEPSIKLATKVGLGEGDTCGYADPTEPKHTQ